MKFPFKKNWFGLIGFIILIPSLILNLFLFREVKKTEPGILVMEVLDGDTVLLEGKVRLRLRHIDAPELQYCGGEKAKAFLKKLVKGKKVLIKEEILDQYGRPMALIYSGDVLVNLEMLKSGWVRYHSDQSSQVGRLKAVAETAKKTQKGIFSPLCYQKENRENPDCKIKGNIDKNSGDKRYYFPGCAQYDFTLIEKDIGEDWFCTEEEAQNAGFIRSNTCPKEKYSS